MDRSTLATLDRVNRDFYRSHAGHFSITRVTPWPGWRRLLTPLRDLAGAAPERPLRILDVGCGNGRLATWLAAELALPHSYLGLDRSLPLLAVATRAVRAGDRSRSRGARRAIADPRPVATSDTVRSTSGGGARWRWLAVDLVTSAGAIPLHDDAFDAAIATGLLHHLPSRALRRSLVRELVRLVRPGGVLALSHWQLASDPRLDGRRLPWSALPGLDPTQVEPGDALLRWGEEVPDPAGGGPVFRYCHQVDEAEAAALESGLGLSLHACFRSDGRGGTANLYRILHRAVVARAPAAPELR